MSLNTFWILLIYMFLSTVLFWSFVPLPSRDPSFLEESGVSNSPLTERTGHQIHSPPLSPGRPVSNNYSPNRKWNCPYVLNFHFKLKFEIVKLSELDIKFNEISPNATIMLHKQSLKVGQRWWHKFVVNDSVRVISFDRLSDFIYVIYFGLISIRTMDYLQLQITLLLASRGRVEKGGELWILHCDV